MPETKYLTVPHLSRKELTRIFSKVQVNKKTGCWEWIAALNTYGYGCIWYKGRQEMAHRLLYAWIFGPIPQGYGSDVRQIDHIVCENTRCCNPVHLRLVTVLVNTERTNSVSAVNRRKTHCIHGHELPEKPNRAGGYGRTCMICRKIGGHRQYLKRIGLDDAERARRLEKFIERLV